MSSYRFAALLACLLTSTVVLHSGCAQQSATKQSGAVLADSAVIHIITVAARDLAVRGDGGGLEAWEITVPDSLTPAWQRARTRLYASLRARPLTAQDTAVGDLNIAEVRVQGDSLFAFIRTGVRWRCAAGWSAGNHTGHEVRARRASGRWQPVKGEAVLFSDGAPCEEVERRRRLQEIPRAIRPTNR